MEWLETILCWWVTILGMLYDHSGKHVTPGGAEFLGGIGEMTLAYLFEIPGDGPGLSLKIKIFRLMLNSRRDWLEDAYQIK